MNTKEFEKSTIETIKKSFEDHPDDWKISTRNDHILERNDGFEIWLADTIVPTASIWNPEYDFEIAEYRKEFTSMVVTFKAMIYNRSIQSRQAFLNTQKEKAKDQIINKLGLSTLKIERKEKLKEIEQQVETENKWLKIKKFFK